MTTTLRVFTAAAGFTALTNTGAQADPALEAQITRGRTAFVTCAACHGMDGKGLPTTPPMAPSLVASKLLNAPAEVPITIVLKGIQKMDAKYLNVMAPLGTAMTDEQVADTLTYARRSWGNTAPAVTAAEVKAVREKFKDINQPLPRTSYEKKAEKMAAEAAGKKDAAPPAK
jgi:mono/diheme cytochrome c family protein